MMVMIMIVESEACGWDDDPFWWYRFCDCTAGHGEKCDECKGDIHQGEEITVCLQTEAIGTEYDDRVSHADFSSGEIICDDKSLRVERHVICSKCEDLRQSLIANGNEPVLGMVWQCHYDVVMRKKYASD